MPTRNIPADGADSEDSELSDNDDEIYQVCANDLSFDTEIYEDDAPPVLPQQRKPVEKNTLRWSTRTINVSPDTMKFDGDVTLPSDITELETPLQFFKFVVTQEMISHIIAQTNLYSVQCRPNKPATISEAEIEQFFGVALYMSVIQLPATRRY